MGGLNLEVFKFGVYVMFPIGIMYYFGTNLDERFSVPDFWPKPEHANKVPIDRDEIQAELARLRARRLYLRDKRAEEEAAAEVASRPTPTVEELRQQRSIAQKAEAGGAYGVWFGWLRPGDAPRDK